MKVLLIFALFTSSAAVSSIPQEAGYKDLVDFQLLELKEPIAGGTGSCGGSSHEPPPRISLDVTLLSVDKSRYMLGDDVEFEVRLTNKGAEPVFLPWDPQRADFEDKAAGADYHYVTISLLLESSDGSEKDLMTGWELLGSPDVAGSLLELQPGNWVQVRAKSKLEIFSDNEFQHRLYSGLEPELSIKPTLLAAAETVAHREGKVYLDSQCLKWGISVAGETTIRVTPREGVAVQR